MILNKKLALATESEVAETEVVDLSEIQDLNGGWCIGGCFSAGVQVTISDGKGNYITITIEYTICGEVCF